MSDNWLFASLRLRCGAAERTSHLRGRKCMKGRRSDKRGKAGTRHEEEDVYLYDTQKNYIKNCTSSSCFYFCFPLLQTFFNSPVKIVVLQFLVLSVICPLSSEP